MQSCAGTLLIQEAVYYVKTQLISLHGFSFRRSLLGPGYDAYLQSGGSITALVIHWFYDNLRGKQNF